MSWREPPRCRDCGVQVARARGDDDEEELPPQVAFDGEVYCVDCARKVLGIAPQAAPADGPAGMPQPASEGRNPSKHAIEPCPACGTRVKPNARRIPHDQTPECLVIRTQAAYKARGWVPLLTPQWVRILTAAGVPIEHAPGATHLEPRLVPTGKARGPQSTVTHDTVAHDVAFAPGSAVMVVSALCKVRMPSDFRARAIAALWERDDVYDAVDAIKRLGGRVTGFVHRLVLEAESKKGATAQARGEPDAEGTEQPG